VFIVFLTCTGKTLVNGREKKEKKE